ncbi:membrane protein [Gordonia phage Guey18]|nr:membrane protein [Gordonia phage Guey18]
MTIWWRFIDHMRNAVALRIRLIWPELALLQAFLFLVAITRGLDYIANKPSNTSNALNVIESALPYWAWGLIYLLPGLVGICGMLQDVLPVRTLAHVILMAAYGAFSAGVVLALVENSSAGGIRSAFDWLAFAAIHLAFANASFDGWKEVRRDKWLKGQWGEVNSAHESDSG